MATPKSNASLNIQRNAPQTTSNISYSKNSILTERISFQADLPASL
jgi:hypothetical protein